MNYNAAICEICHNFMTFRQLRRGVYWLPNMDNYELAWARYEGFEHRFAHMHCWANLRPKRKDLIRICAFKGQEPRRQGALV